MSKNNLYFIIFIACTAGYIWLFIGITSQSKNKSVEVCLVKSITGIPCPSCGSTRSVIALSHGNFKEALLINPLGYMIAAIMLTCPIWIVFDLMTKRNTLFKFYNKMEFYLNQSRYSIPLILLILTNWIWNIQKAL